MGYIWDIYGTYMGHLRKLAIVVQLQSVFKIVVLYMIME
ncbi:hypothetical protein C7475_101978 [Chitinophaga sp. S165]|nr:hypothetical protein C7475_101978 [Chitinophaga sp. S165]